MKWIKSDYKLAIEGTEKAMSILCEHCEEKWQPGGCICNAHIALEDRLEKLKKSYEEYKDDEDDYDEYDF